MAGMDSGLPAITSTFIKENSSVNLFKKLTRSLTAIAIVLMVFLAVGVGPARAADCFQTVKANVQQDGTFAVKVQGKIPADVRVGSAVLSFPASSDKGTIESIKIVDTDLPSYRQLEFGCGPLTVSDGTDLITACGGPAYLDKGNTIYKAFGSEFPPGETFSVCLAK